MSKALWHSPMVTNARADWFVDPSSGNLRLALGTTAPLDQAQRHELAQYDIDGILRSVDSSVVIGASELISELEVGNASSGGDKGGGTIAAPILAWLLLGAIYLRSRVTVT